MELLGVALAAIASFVLSAVLCGLPPVAAQVARSTRPRAGVGLPAQLAFVALRGLVAALVLLALLHQAGRAGAGAGLLLGALTALLPVAILAGAVVHEDVPVPTALIHSTDWVLKLLVSGLLVGVFR